MRHKYRTRGIVLSRVPAGETSALIAVITPELGLVRSHAQGVRAAGARLASALATFAESDLLLVRGRERWRVAGAALEENWFARLPSHAARERAGRFTGLLLRLATGDAPEDRLYPVAREFFTALSTLPETAHDGAEVLAALYLLSILGFDDGALPVADLFDDSALARANGERMSYVSRINRGIEASGL